MHRIIGIIVASLLNPWTAIVDARLSTTKRRTDDVFVIGTECWKHDEGSFCFEADGSKFRSFYTKKNGATHYNDFIDGKLYTYSIFQDINEDSMIQMDVSEPGEYREPSNRKLVDAYARSLLAQESLTGIKYGCTVQDASSPVDIGDTDILESHGDGSSLWRVDHWVIPVDKDSVPISITVMEEDEPFVYISEKVSLLETIDGCDPDTESNDAPEVPEENADILHRTLLAHDPSISEEKYFSMVNINNKEEKNRELVPDALVQFQAWASGTYWCGAGTNRATTLCPDASKSDGGYDYNADHACRRHDHGKKYTITTVGIPRLECYVDRDLKNAGGHNWAVSAVYGDWSPVAGTVGCYNYEPYLCWRRWRLGYYCKGWDVNIGPWRYNNAVKTEGYLSKGKVCSGDIGGY